MNYFLILPNKQVFQKIEKISLLYKKLLKNCMFFIEKNYFMKQTILLNNRSVNKRAKLTKI